MVSTDNNIIRDKIEEYLSFYNKENAAECLLKMWE